MIYMEKNCSAYNRFSRSFIFLLLVLNLTCTPVFADVPNVNEIYIEFKASPSDGSQILLSIRHSGATLTHNIIQIELEIDGETIQLTPLPPSEQVGNTVIEYNFTINRSQFSNARARARCSVHGWSNWTQLNNRLYELIVEPEVGAGSTDPVPAVYTYDVTFDAQMIAFPEPGWSLSHWVFDGEDVGNQNPYTVVMDRGHRIKAVFTEVTPSLNYSLDIEPPDGLGATDPAFGNYVFDQNEMVSITAMPESDWEFDRWILDDLNVGDENPITVTMERAHSVKAVFIELSPVTLLTFTVEVSVGSGVTDPEPGVYVYYQNVIVSVKAIPATGWVLDHWLFEDVDVGLENPYSVNVDGDHSIQAVFKQEVVDSDNGIPGYSFSSILIGFSLFIIIFYKQHKPSFPII